MAKQPNILFSMCDDQRHDCMGCAGHPFIDTPAMDRLANEGIRFANGFTDIPLCAPSRASHLSGVYPHTHGAAHNRAPINPDLKSCSSCISGEKIEPPGNGNKAIFNGPRTVIDQS